MPPGRVNDPPMSPDGKVQCAVCNKIYDYKYDKVSENSKPKHKEGDAVIFEVEKGIAINVRTYANVKNNEKDRESWQDQWKEVNTWTWAAVLRNELQEKGRLDN